MNTAFLCASCVFLLQDLGSRDNLLLFLQKVTWWDCVHYLIFYLLCGGYGDLSEPSKYHSVGLTHNLTLFRWGQNLFSSINPVFTGISAKVLSFLLCCVSNLAWVGCRQLIIWLNLKLFEQAVSKLQNLVRGREGYFMKFLEWVFFPPLPWPTNHTDWAGDVKELCKIW